MPISTVYIDSEYHHHTEYSPTYMHERSQMARLFTCPDSGFSKIVHDLHLFAVERHPQWRDYMTLDAERLYVLHKGINVKKSCSLTDALKLVSDYFHIYVEMTHENIAILRRNVSQPLATVRYRINETNKIPSIHNMATASPADALTMITLDLHVLVNRHHRQSATTSYGVTAATTTGTGTGTINRGVVNSIGSITADSIAGDIINYTTDRFGESTINSSLMDRERMRQKMREQKEQLEREQREQRELVELERELTLTRQNPLFGSWA